MREWPHYYILIDRLPVAVDNMTWARAFESRHRTEPDPWRVARDEFQGCRVSTMFLGLDHNFLGGEPVLFETMIFGGPLDGEMWRYATYAQAEAGHAEAVAQAKIAAAKIKSIADNAGAKTKG
jgi:hypothetical protein